MPQPSQNYSEEFKLDAIEFYRNGTLSKAQAARELGISIGSLRSWIKQLDEGSAARCAVIEENRQLRKKLLHLERQREILKKAAVILGGNLAATRRTPTVHYDSRDARQLQKRLHPCRIFRGIRRELFPLLRLEKAKAFP